MMKNRLSTILKILLTIYPEHHNPPPPDYEIRITAENDVRRTATGDRRVTASTPLPS